MIYEFTLEERSQLEAIDKKYEALKAEKEAEMSHFNPPDPALEKACHVEFPDRPTPPTSKSKSAKEKYLKEVEEYSQKLIEMNEIVQKAYEAYMNSASPEWRRLNDEIGDLIVLKSQEIKTFVASCDRKRFSQLRGDKAKILDHARDQAKKLILNRYAYYKKVIETGVMDGDNVEMFSAIDLRVGRDSSEFWLDAEEIREAIRDHLKLHYEALKDDPDGVKQLDSIVMRAISSSPYVSSHKGERFKSIEIDKARELISFNTTKPKELMTLTSKVASELFAGDFTPGTGKRINVQRKDLQKKTPVFDVVTVGLEDLKTYGVEIKGRRELTQYDWEIHDAIMTLFKAGNEFITSSMIFDLISGKDGATLNPKQQEHITNSITKLMYTVVKIDASEEAKKFNKKIDEFVYDGNLVPAERVTVTLNGTTTETIHPFRTPPLGDYSERLSQIARIDVKYLNTPVNKNEKTIVLQGFLFRRISAIKRNAHFSRVITYESIYDIVDLSDIKSPGALRNKKNDVRNTTKKILDYWVETGFIVSYSENIKAGGRGQIESVTIEV